MRIVILDGYTENPGDLTWRGFEKLGSVTLYDRTPQDQIPARIGDQVPYTWPPPPCSEAPANAARPLQDMLSM